jgi:hypothetical protein
VIDNSTSLTSFTDLTTTDPRWASTTTYQGVPWAQIRAGDLTDERADLFWVSFRLGCQDALSTV